MGQKQRAWGLRIAWTALALVVFGVGGFAFWQLVGTNQLAANRSTQAIQDFRAACAQSDETEVIGLVTLPGKDAIPVLKGVAKKQLETGVGWYPNSAEPGENGNLAIAGYRLTNGQPFHDLLNMKKGDQITLETCTDTYLYEIEVTAAELSVDADDAWVLEAVPGAPGKVAEARMLTLTTSQDLLPTQDRSVAFAKFVGESD